MEGAATMPLWAVILTAVLSSTVVASLLGFAGIVYQGRIGRPQSTAQTKSLEMESQGAVVKRLSDESERAWKRADEAETEAEAARTEADLARKQAKMAQTDAALCRRDLETLAAEFHQFRFLVETYLREHGVPVPEWVRTDRDTGG